MRTVASAYSKEKIESIKGYLGHYFDDCLKPAEKRAGEFAFFVNAAKETGGPVLDLACGGGRMLMVLAEAGIDCVGFDASSHSLEFAKKEIAKLPKNIQDRISLVEGDMCDFNFFEQYPLIINAYYSFWYNFDTAAMAEQRIVHPKFDINNECRTADEYNERKQKIIEQIIFREAEQCVRSIIHSLKKGGRFIIDMPVSHPDKVVEGAASWWKSMSLRYNFTLSFFNNYEKYPEEKCDYKGSYFRSSILIGEKI